MCERLGASARATGLKALILAALAAAVFAGSAEAHTCGSNWCSGSDSNTSVNTQGNADQVYIGEVSTYTNDFYGTSGIAWSNTGANGAVSRFNAGTGIGVEDYYFGGGAGANNQGVSSFCWGAEQAYHQAYDMYTYHNSYWAYEEMAFLDIESPISNYGWYSTETAANVQVFDGWSDYISGKATNCGLPTNSYGLSQFGVYSAPDAWNTATNSDSVPNTYIWTYENSCNASFPGTNWGGRALFWVSCCFRGFVTGLVGVGTGLRV